MYWKNIDGWINVEKCWQVSLDIDKDIKKVIFA